MFIDFISYKIGVVNILHKPSLYKYNMNYNDYSEDSFTVLYLELFNIINIW